MEYRTKYPRSLHLPWSPGRSRDDLVLSSISHFEGTTVVVTEKRDGENTSLYADGMHARSTTAAAHPSQSWVRRLQAQVGHDIPQGWRVCGENLYARHAIPYELDTFFEVFSIWDERNTALSWDETEEWAELLGLTTVPVLYRGEWPGEDFLGNLWQEHCQSIAPAQAEGYVVRLAGAFSYSDFSRSLAKFVRAGHVSSEKHWKHNWTANKLK